MVEYTTRPIGKRSERVLDYYSINTLGAAAGNCVTGIALLPALGIANSVWVAVVVGILVAAGAVLLDRQIAPRTIASTQPTDTPSPIRIPRLLIAAIALAGCIGLFYQIAGTRMLIPVVGSSVYAFTIILSTVLIGIGVGALLAAVPSFRESSCWRAVALTMGLGALSALAGLFAVNELLGLFTAMAQGTADHPWLLFLSGRAGRRHRLRAGLLHGRDSAAGNRRLAQLNFIGRLGRRWDLHGQYRRRHSGLGAGGLRAAAVARCD